MNLFFGGEYENYVGPNPSFEYAPSKNIFHIPSTSSTGLTGGFARIDVSLYSSFTYRIQQTISSSTTYNEMIHMVILITNHIRKIHLSVQPSKLSSKNWYSGISHIHLHSASKFSWPCSGQQHVIIGWYINHHHTHHNALNMKLDQGENHVFN